MIAARRLYLGGHILVFQRKKDLLRQVIERVNHYHYYLMSLQPSKMGEFLNQLKRCIVAYRSLIKLQYNVHLRNVIYIVFFVKNVRMI